MLDTVKLESPELGEELARQIEARCVRRSAVDIGSGELLYELTTGSLEGSYDHRVSIRVMRSRMVSQIEIERERLPDDRTRLKGRTRTFTVSCEPYLLLEASVHKAMLGHNVYGGPESVREPCEWLVGDVAARLGVDLPNGAEWLVRRIDWAEVYELPDYPAVEEYVWGLNSAEYPRRSVARYGRESIFAAGRTTAVKAYHKGPEFSKHDHKRLRDIMQDADLQDLQHYANRVLRWEVSVKAKKLDEDHGKKPLVSEISSEYLRKLHYREVRRLVREGEADVKTVRKQKDVRDRLLQEYDARKAGLLLGTWHQLVTLGEKETRRVIPDRTFRRHKKLLGDAGVSWIGADVLVVPKVSSLPADFAPTERDPRRRGGEDAKVAQLLAPYRAA
jgi:II/X family phage/plasmid replication protein